MDCFSLASLKASEEVKSELSTWAGHTSQLVFTVLIFGIDNPHSFDRFARTEVVLNQNSFSIGTKT